MTKQKHFYLVRGLIREARHWGDFPEKLKAQHPGAMVTTIDIPGAGEHFTVLSPLSMKRMVEQMRLAFLKEKSTDEESILVAISLGGMIAAQWLKDYGQDFSKVVLINTSYGGISPLFDRLMPSALMHLLPVPTLKGREKEARILKLVSNHAAIFDKTLDLWEVIQKERPVSFKNTLRQLAAGATFRIGNFKPTQPIFILASTHDRMVSVNCSRAIARIWEVPIYEHPTAGHDLTADDPEWITQKIKELV